METTSIELSCKDELTDGFELAIEQLGYTIVDSSWDNEKQKTHYKVVKK